METKQRWVLAATAAIAWLLVGTFAVQETNENDSGSYTMFMLALIIGSALVAGVAATITQFVDRSRLRTAGFAVTGLGVLSTIVAWALPLWMTLLGVGFVLLALAARPQDRRPLIVLAASHALGIVALTVGTVAEVGERDEWGDYPLAGGVALIVTAALTLIALVDFSTRADVDLRQQRDASLAL